jgi:hypothetical protein
MRLLTLLPLLPKKAALAAEKNDSPLIRCAAHSARISDGGTPHTFSLYDLKKSSYRRFPNRFVTQSSSDSSTLPRFVAARRYDAMQRVSSIGPSFLITSPPRSG